jgi:hypothetical protein
MGLRRGRPSAAAIAVVCCLLGACHRAPPTAADAAAAAGAAESAAEGVILTPEQIGKLGLVTQLAQPTQYSQHASGYGVVVSHDTIAQVQAELRTARATEQLSRSALKRAQQLSGTPGAVSADVEEAAAQKAAIDAAAMTLSAERSTSTLGMNPPWQNRDRDATLEELAKGKIKLLRATFPLGALSGGTPRSLRAARLGVTEADSGWKLNVVWDAPADSNIPGRSYFALLKGADVGEGERLTVWAPVGGTLSGIVIPAAAVVMSEGKYWCYMEKKPGTFVRIAIDATQPTTNGYFVSEGISGGDRIVVTAAGQLLAKELGAGAQPD